jgi:hypothetical protein
LRQGPPIGNIILGTKEDEKMLKPEDVKEMLRRQPFQPFQIETTTGEVFDIRHPDLVLVGTRALIIGIPGEEHSEYFDRSCKVALMHVVKLKELAGQN